MPCHNRFFALLGSSLAVAVMVLAAPVARASTTLENLQSAFQGESNAHARYLAFAHQADADGYGEVASLFRAAARAEAIHAENHSVVIRQLGGTAEPKLDAVKVGTTKENLQTAIKGETWERDTMYPEYLRQAREEGVSDAARTFNLAGKAEAEHARLFSNALASIDTLKGSASKTFYVCPVCGYTTAELTFERCPVCFTPKEQFEKVS